MGVLKWHREGKAVMAWLFFCIFCPLGALEEARLTMSLSFFSHDWAKLPEMSAHLHFTDLNSQYRLISSELSSCHGLTQPKADLVYTHYQQLHKIEVIGMSTEGEGPVQNCFQFRLKC